ncbi:hypothetical protein, partial [Spirosoma flavus]
LQGYVTASGDTYFAEIIGRFVGYRLAKVPLCPALYDKTVFVNVAANVPANVYYFQEYKDEAAGKCGYNWLETTYSFQPDPSGGLIDITPALSGPHTLTTDFKACQETSVVNIRGNVFVLEVVNGNLRVRGTWQDFGKCAQCPAQAEAALQAALSKARAANAGVLSLTTMVVSATTMS